MRAKEARSMPGEGACPTCIDKRHLAGVFGVIVLVVVFSWEEGGALLHLGCNLAAPKNAKQLFALESFLGTADGRHGGIGLRSAGDENGGPILRPDILALSVDLRCVVRSHVQVIHLRV